MTHDTNPCVDTIERDERDLSSREVVWMGAPYTEERTNPACVELFVSQERAEGYVESTDETRNSERRWVAWEEDERDGRQLVDTENGVSIGVVSPLRAAVETATPPFTGSILDRLVPSESTLREILPVVSDRPAIDREAIPETYFDAVLLTDRGHLELRVGESHDDGPARYLDALTEYTRKTVDAGTGAADDRVARDTIRELDGYFRVVDDTAYYGKPRYRLAKKLSDWGGDTGRCATLELWLLFQLLLRLYPEHVSWEADYKYPDDH